MHVAMLRQDRRGFVEVELPVLPADAQQLGAAGKKLRRAAFVRLDVCAFMAKDAVKGPAKMSQRERVGRRAVEDQEGLAVRLENFAHLVADAPGPLILAVGGGGVVICLGQGGPGFRANRGGIIARELMALARRHREHP